MRDMLYYANDNNIQGAVINVDWRKAFDSIEHDLLFKIMRKWDSVITLLIGLSFFITVL